MRFTVEYPIGSGGYDASLLAPEGFTRVVRAVDELGFDAIAFTEHPAPSHKWLLAGGHESLDVTSALSYCAAITERVRLMTYLLVVPYRNPLLAAKALATVDVLSGGRATAVVGSGYLKSEFRALGVDFEDRNALLDEGIEVMRGVWSQLPFDHEGRHFTASGVAALPQPVQPGGVPIWIGGNSGVARRRAARCQGWSPLLIDEQLAQTTRTAALTTIEQLRSAVAEVRELAAHTRGEAATVDVQVQSPQSEWLRGESAVEEHLDHLDQLAGAGVDWFVIQPPSGSVEACIEGLERYAQTVGLSSRAGSAVG